MHADIQLESSGPGNLADRLACGYVPAELHVDLAQGSIDFAEEHGHDTGLEWADTAPGTAPGVCMAVAGSRM